MRGILAKIPRTIPILGLVALGAGCNSGGGPTAIEIPIDRIVLAGCTGMIETETCTFRAEAFSGEQRVDNPVLRWSTSNATVASLEEQSSTSALVRARQSGLANIVVSNTTGTVSATQSVNVFAASPK